jgi:FecR protein
MNFYASAANGNHSDSLSLIEPDSHFPDAIVVPDADLLIHGSYHRSGLDLVLTGRDGQHHVIASYFASEHPPALAAPDGAHFSADMVELLAGSPAPHEYAQAQGQTAAPADSIGKIQKVSGDVSVQRNGVSVALNVGDVVYKSDIIVTGVDAKCGLTFPDGTALEILPNSRMALNEYDYDAKSTSNQALFTLVEGTFGFVAGKVAHTGDMKIGTPVATMGIRGTTGVVQEVNSANGGTTYSYSVYDDPGTSHSGSWDMFVDNPDGTESLALTVSQPGFVTFVTLRGLHEPRLISTVPLTASQIDAARLIMNDLSELAGLAGPHSIGIPGSGDNPLLQLPPNFQPEIFSNGPNVTYNYQFLPPPGPAAPQNPQDPVVQTATTASNVFIWSSPNNQIFPNGSFWNLGAAPISADDIVVILTGISQYTENFTFQSLTIDGSAQNGGLPPGELDMMGGGLTVTNGLDVAGTLLLQGDPPTFTSYGTSIVESTGEIIAQGAGTVVEFMPDPSNPTPAFVLVSNFGLIAAESGGLVEFLETSVTNEAAATSTAQPGLIESIGAGSLVLFEAGSTLDNGGTVTAKDSGTIEFLHAGTVINEPGSNSGGVETAPGEIESTAAAIIFTDTDLDNFGGVSADSYGTITFSDATIVNEAGTTSGEDSSPGGEIEAKNDGFIGITGGKIVNEAGATLDAEFGGLIDITSAEVDNNQFAVITASHNAEIDLLDTNLSNEGTVAAEDHSRIVIGAFDSGSVTNLGTIEALDHSTVLFVDGAVTNYNQVTGQGDGVIAAFGAGAVAELLSTTIVGGTLETRDGGAIEIISPEPDVTNVVVFDGSGEAVTVDGFVQVEPGATLKLVGTIDNDGTIDVDSATSGSDLAVDGTVELRGSGVVTLDGPGDEITGVGGDPLLENYSNIAGSGKIGGGGLTLFNEATGTIDADDGRFRPLVIDTGKDTITNDGLVEAVCYSVLAIESQLDNFGRVIASSGEVVVAADLLNESGGYVGSTFGGAVTLDDIKITNDASALIEADGACSIVNIAYDLVDNDGLVEAKNGGSVFVANSFIDNIGGTFAADGWGSVIDLSNVLISQGNLETSSGGLIQTVCGVSTLSDVSISGDLAVGSGTTLILDDGTTMDDGVIFVAKGATLDIEASTGATLSGVTIIDYGTVNVDYNYDTSPVTLTLDDASSVFSGTIAIGDRGTLAVGSGGAMLDGVDVDVGPHGNIVVGPSASPGLSLAVDEEMQAPSAILTLDDGTNVSGGTLTVEHDAELQIEHGIRGPGATLEGVNVNDFGVIQVDAPTVATTLTLDDGTELSGSGLLSIGPSGLVDIEGAWGAIFNGIDVDVSGHGSLAIGLDSISNLTIAQTVDFDGAGTVFLDSQSDWIIGSGHGATLDNDIAIQGEGTIGGPLELVNEASGVIDADIAGKILTIHTGNAFDNMGTLEASHGGILQIDDPVQNFGGNALIEGGILDFVSTTNVNHITFDNGIGTPSYGELIFNDLSAGYSATIDGFAGKEGDLGHSDAIDLAHVQRSAISYSEHNGNTTITIQEGHGAVAVLTLAGFTGDLDLDSDGHGGTLITDPPPTDSGATAASPIVSSAATADGDAGMITFADADTSSTPTATVTPESSNDLGQFGLGAVTESNGSSSVEFDFNGDQVHLASGQTLTQSYNVSLTDAQNPAADQSQAVSVTIGGPGNDNFVFTPGVGADTVLNFNPQQDTIEFDHFTNVQTVQELQSLITTNTHGDAVIDLGNHDSVTLANTTTAQLQQAIQNGHVILH